MTDIVPIRNPSLMTLLAAFAAVDEEIEALNLDPELDLLDAGKMKIDGYKFVIDKLKAQEFYLAERCDEYEKSLKTVRSQMKRIKDHLIFAMDTHKFQKFTGYEYVASIRNNPSASLVIKGQEPNAYTKSRFDKYVRTKYEWDKSAIKKDLEKNDELQQFCKLERGRSLYFNLAKDVIHEPTNDRIAAEDSRENSSNSYPTECTDSP